MKYQNSSLKYLVQFFLLTLAWSSNTLPVMATPYHYRNLRYEERPQELRHYPRIQQLKYLPFDQEGQFWLSLGGSWRVRSEGWLGFQLDPTQNALLGLSQLRLHADLNLGPYLRIFGEGISALSTPRNLMGGIRTIDMDAADIQNLFIDLRWPMNRDNLAVLRLGRQEMDFGKERLVSSLRWVNSRRTFDAVRAIGQWESFRIDGFYTQLVQVDKLWLNTSTPAHSLYGIYTTALLEWLPGKTDIYWLGQHHQQATFSNLSGVEDRQTLGARLELPLPHGFSLEAESAGQFGRFAEQDILACFLAAQMTWQSPWPLQPVFGIGLDYASGDNNPNDAQLNTFNQLFPLSHAYYGLADLLGRQNALDLYTSIQLKIQPELTASLYTHGFWRPSLQDSHYLVNGKPWPVGLLSVDSASAWTGLEMDFILNYRFSPEFQLELGFSYFIPGNGLIADTPQLSFGYLQGLWQF